MAITLCKKIIDDGSCNTYYGLDHVTANAIGWAGICTLGSGDRRGMSIHPTTTGDCLKFIAEWPETPEPLLAKLVREKIIAPDVAGLALNRAAMVEEADYKLVDAEIQKALADRRASATVGRTAPGAGTVTLTKG